MSKQQRCFLFEYLCEYVPQTDDEEARTFAQRLQILPTFIDSRRKSADNTRLCSQELLGALVGDIFLLPETLLVRII